MRLAADLSSRAFLVAMLSLGVTACAAQVVIQPGGLDAGSDAGSDVDHGDAPFCDNDAGLNGGYCPPSYHCELFQGQMYLWNVCCPAGEDGGGVDCQGPSH